MQQGLHLLIVDCASRAALAANHASRWLLPVVTCHERLRAESHVARWAAEQGVACDVLGQWLGRISSNPVSLDWLVAVRAARTDTTAPRGLQWIPLDALDPDRALLDYQGWAIARAVRNGELPAVSGPFGTLCWLEEVRAWMADLVGDGTPLTVTPYRLTAYEVVLRVETAGRPVFFKGMTAERAVEPRATQALFEVEPRCFPRTLALERRADGSIWWVTAECPGRPLRRPVSFRHAAEVARALARVQQRALASFSVHRELPALDVERALEWCLERLNDDPVRRDAIARAFDVLLAAMDLRTWIPLDLDPTNVMVEEDRAGSSRVAFIDLDDSYCGPAPLAMAVFARRCRDTSLDACYERAWTPPLDRLDWPSFETVAAAIEAWLGWSRVALKAHRGELHGPWGQVLNAHLFPGFKT